MSSGNLPQNDPVDDFGGPYFYRVSSELSATIYQPRSSTEACLFQARCGFTYYHVSLECIGAHLRLRDTHASPFISVFSNFAEALREAYGLYVQGHETIQVVRIQASELVAAHIDTSDECSALIPLWQGKTVREDQWLCMAEIRLLLGIDRRYIRPSEWLACGSIPKSRYSAAWPIIGGRLYFDEQRSEDLIDLFTDLCGHVPDSFRGHGRSERYQYDWNDERFVGTAGLRTLNVSIQETGVAGAGLGLGLAVSQFARPTPFGYAGYLRGMVVMD